MLAITKASLRAIFRSPSAVIFSFIFPFIFIIVFGFIGNNGTAPVFKIAVDDQSDTANVLFDSIKSNARIKIVRFYSQEELRSSLIKGRIAGVLTITKKLLDFEYLETDGPFFRTHRSYLVNLNHVKKIDKKDFVLIMSNEAQVHLAQDKKNQLIERFTV